VKRYLADTHALLWFAAGATKRLGPRARRAFQTMGAGAVEILISVVTLWEVALLHDEGAIRLPFGFTAWCDGVEACAGLTIEPLLRGDIDAARGLRALRDPHDRLIAGTALRLGVPLITADRRIGRLGRMPTVW
jgi:PIN domain nuclease of toxin-antitoxin system